MLTVSFNIDGGNGNDNAKNKNFGRMKNNSRAARAARTLKVLRCSLQNKNVKKLTTFAVETTAKYTKVNLQRSYIYFKGACSKAVVTGNGNDCAKNKNFGRMKKNSRATRAALTLKDSALFS